MKFDRIDIRVSKEEKEIYRNEAEKRGVKLSEFIRKALENEITGGRK